MQFIEKLKSLTKKHLSKIQVLEFLILALVLAFISFKYFSSGKDVDQRRDYFDGHNGDIHKMKALEGSSPLDK